jgi:formylglycine-generating enzyme required for sulfatase activity
LNRRLCLPNRIVRLRDGVLMVLVLPRDPTIPPFYFDETEVTQGCFDHFRESTGYRTYAETAQRNLGGYHVLLGGPRVSGDRLIWRTEYVDWCRRTYDPKTLDRLPARQVSFDGAWDYAKWVGCALPTASQFNVVLCIDSQGGPYPWGNDRTPPPHFGNYGDRSLAVKYPGTDAVMIPFPDWTDGFALVAPVKSFRPDSLGIYDVSGNVNEQCLMKPDSRARQADVDVLHGWVSADCGGSYAGVIESLRCPCSDEFRSQRFAWGEGTGFRCARSVDSLKTGEIAAMGR